MVGRGVIGVLSVVVGVAGHGSLVYPRPRNSIDYLQGVNTQWYVQPVTVHVTCECVGMYSVGMGLAVSAGAWGVASSLPALVHVTCSNVLGCGIVLGWGWQSVLELGGVALSLSVMDGCVDDEIGYGLLGILVPTPNHLLYTRTCTCTH
jgi:hypothetical protein